MKHTYIVLTDPLSLASGLGNISVSPPKNDLREKEVLESPNAFTSYSIWGKTTKTEASWEKPCIPTNDIGNYGMSRLFGYTFGTWGHHGRLVCWTGPRWLPAATNHWMSRVHGLHWSLKSVSWPHGGGPDSRWRREDNPRRLTTPRGQEDHSCLPKTRACSWCQVRCKLVSSITSRRLSLKDTTLTPADDTEFESTSA